ncbi:MAG: ABC transporter permease [Oligoflexia bacterium]|nr:ABC transporter permease [Oligoflexia bacterium]
MLLDDLILSAVRISLPLIFAAYGGMLSEKSGVANIALEAYLLFSSFCAAAVMALTHNLGFSILSGLLGGVFVGIIFSFFTVKVKSDQIIAGMALNILATGLIPVLCKAFYGTSGQTPSLEIQDRISSTTPFIIAALLVFIGTFILFKKSVFGLRVTAAGDHPPALRSQGINVDFVRVKAILIGAAIASVGGIYLSLGAGSGYTRNMSAGRGFIALAALIFGRWKPIPTLLACLFFGFFDSLQIFLQTSGTLTIPTQFVQVLPYLLTLVLLAVPTGKAQKNFAPQAINRPDL